MKFASDNFNAAGASCGAKGFDVPAAAPPESLMKSRRRTGRPPRIAPHA